VWKGLGARLVGERVVVEPLASSHEERLLAAAREMDWTWMHHDPSRSPEVFHGWLMDALARTEAGLDFAFAVLDAGSGDPIGSTRYLALRPEHGGLEIGWTWLTRSRWSTGANVEAKLLLLEHAFERLGCIRVEFKTDERNERSRRALEALPATFEGVFRKHMLVGDDGTRLRHSAYYSIVDDDWPSVRANLERRLAR
jgi:RimJ/RimL family protein N-acetyltransferase